MMMRRKPDISNLTPEEIAQGKKSFIEGAKADIQKPVEAERQLILL